MLRCREITQLVSESMERELPFRQRMQVWMHLAMCRVCSAFARQIRALRTVIRVKSELSEPVTDDPEARLSTEARERIRAALRKDEA